MLKHSLSLFQRIETFIGDRRNFSKRHNTPAGGQILGWNFLETLTVNCLSLLL